jgi:hypothetical protein
MFRMNRSDGLHGILNVRGQGRAIFRQIRHFRFGGKGGSDFQRGLYGSTKERQPDAERNSAVVHQPGPAQRRWKG